MAYIDSVLIPGEQIRHRGKLHWIIYVPGFILLPLAGIGVILLVSAWIRRWCTEIYITDKRVIYKVGWISRHTMEMNMNKVESVDVSQSIMGRLFGYGTITIRGTGAGIEPLRRIAAPMSLRNAITVS